MAKLSDLIEDILKGMIDDNNGMIEITRGQLAQQVNCVPSQITYVLMTRFTNSHGYLVESRRGGGGWIRIQRINNNLDISGYLMHAINSMPKRMSQQDVKVYIQNFLDREIIEYKTSRLILAALGDQSLNAISQPIKDEVRVDILQNMLVQLVINNEEIR